jgi:hypothetical protein
MSASTFNAAELNCPFGSSDVIPKPPRDDGTMLCPVVGSDISIR